MADAIKNFAKSSLSTGYNSAATSIVLTAGGGAKFPTPPFNAVWWDSTDYADPSDDPNVEIVRVTAISTDTLTITRAQEGSSASNKNTAGKTYTMIQAATAKTVTDLLAASNNLSDVASAATARSNLGLGVSMASSFQSHSNLSNTANSSTETNELMGGLAFTFTPSKVGKALLLFQATMQNDSGNTMDIEVRFGTGAAPTAGAAFTGTLVAFSPIAPASAAEIMLVCFPGIFSGLTVGTTYWLDVAFGARGGGTTHVYNPNITLLELAA